MAGFLIFLGIMVPIAFLAGWMVGRERGFNEGADYQASVDEPLMGQDAAPQEGAW